MGSLAGGLTWLMNQVGYAICHQMPDRSLSYGGRALPVCARDTGIFLGFTACFLILLLAYGAEPRRYPKWPGLLALALFIAPAAVDAVTSYAGMRESTNAVRLVTGSLAGTGLAALVFPLAVTAARPSSEEGRRGAALHRWWQIPSLLAVPAAVSLLLLLPEWPGGYWLWAPAVTLSILFTLGALNFTMAALLIAWAAGEERLPGPLPLAGIAAAASLAEIALSNRLHWLVRGVS